MLSPRSLLVVLIFIAGKGQSTPDPECYMTLPEIAKYYGYPGEAHIVRTRDDYILELHRIPYGRNNGSVTNPRPVVFMQHGLLADGNNFLPNLANESAATVFADAGFDVWVSNSRGTPPSQKHIGYGPEDARFWNFTWQEMSIYDLTASVDYVLKETGQKFVYYIGHSQGTIIMFDRLSDDPDFSKKIRQFHALAPVATVSHIGGLFRLFGNRIFDIVEFILHRVPNYPLEIPRLIQKILSLFCSLPYANNVCTLDIGFVDGKEKLYNLSRVGTYMCHMPAATSSKDLLHWVQMVKARKFQRFDYGPIGNQIEYGRVGFMTGKSLRIISLIPLQTDKKSVISQLTLRLQPTPPGFNLTEITVPTYLYWSKDDILADTEDIRETILLAMNATIKGNLELPHYTHLDFVYGINAAREVYVPIINAIKNDVNQLDQQQMLRDNRIY